MKVLITNEALNIGNGVILYNASVYSEEFGGYVGYLENGVKMVIATEDGAIIVEDGDEDIEHLL
jgi:hypothetical protein